jgi:energy-coupling factor transporter ATP-binding protein EcfA2
MNPVDILIGRILAGPYVNDCFSSKKSIKRIRYVESGTVSFECGHQQPPILIVGKNGIGKTYTMRHLNRLAVNVWGADNVKSINISPNYNERTSQSRWQIDKLSISQPNVLFIDFDTCTMDNVRQILRHVALCTSAYIIAVSCQSEIQNDASTQMLRWKCFVKEVS